MNQQTRAGFAKDRCVGGLAPRDGLDDRRDDERFEVATATRLSAAQPGALETPSYWTARYSEPEDAHAQTAEQDGGPGQGMRPALGGGGW